VVFDVGHFSGGQIDEVADCRMFVVLDCCYGNSGQVARPTGIEAARSWNHIDITSLPPFAGGCEKQYFGLRFLRSVFSGAPIFAGRTFPNQAPIFQIGICATSDRHFSSRLVLIPLSPLKLSKQPILL
jgi:hypothetical protein